MVFGTVLLLLLSFCTGGALDECPAPFVPEDEMTPQEFWEGFVLRSQPMVSRSVHFDEKAPFQRLNDRGMLLEHLGDTMVNLAVSSSPVFERVEPRSAWPVATSFWRRWWGAKGDLPQHALSIRDAPWSRDSTRCNVQEGFRSEESPCSRFTLDKVVVRPRIVRSTLGAVLAGGAKTLPAHAEHKYIEYEALPPKLADLISWWRPVFARELFNKSTFLGLWMGLTETTAFLHFDAEENLFLQLAGEREWTLYPPAALEQSFMYEVNEADAGSEDDVNLSFFTSTAVETDERPSNAIVVRLRAGDMLYLPSYWWHEVKATPDAETGLSVGINMWSPPVRQQTVPRPLPANAESATTLNVGVYGKTLFGEGGTPTRAWAKLDATPLSSSASSLRCVSRAWIVGVALALLSLGIEFVLLPAAKPRVLRAILDNTTHGICAMIAAWGAALGRPATVVAFLCACALDVDHFVEAGSFSLRDATSLSRRPFGHAATLALAVLSLAGILAPRRCRTLVAALALAWSTHLLRDGLRRGLWLPPFGFTPPLPPVWFIFVTALLLPAALGLTKRSGKAEAEQSAMV